MTLEIGLLVLESVLLVATVILLGFSLKEGRGRDELLKEVTRATKTLTRQEYFLGVVDSMMDAKTEIMAVITGRAPSGGDLKRTKEIRTYIEAMKAKGVTIRYLLPRFHDRLFIGRMYSKAGANVRYISCLTANDLRYMLVDDKTVVIGVPEHTGVKEATGKGYKIPSEDLAAILRFNFDECWNEGISYDEYLTEVVHEAGASLKALSQEVGIPLEELESKTA